jgi:hypothetical protein
MAFLCAWSAAGGTVVWVSTSALCGACVRAAAQARKLQLLKASMCDLCSSVTMDSWSNEQLRKMQAGGNGKLNAFFKQYGIDKYTDIGEKYNTKAAEVGRAAWGGRQGEGGSSNDSATSRPALLTIPLSPYSPLTVHPPSHSPS